MLTGNEPASPSFIDITQAGYSQEFVIDGNKPYNSGLTTRQYFAAMAMQGLITADLDNDRDAAAPLSSKAIASLAVTYADALIAELNK